MFVELQTRAAVPIALRGAKYFFAQSLDPLVLEERRAAMEELGHVVEHS